MTPRLMVVCLGGLAGTGGLVCCDLNEGLEAEAQTEDEIVEEPALEAEADEGVH